MLNTIHDVEKVTQRLPWEIEPEWLKTHLISRLRGACDCLYLHGFLTDNENLEIRIRIDSWNEKQVQTADQNGSGVSTG
jgi:hypothetical protein